MPRVVASSVAQTAMNKLLRAPSFHRSEQTVVIPGSEQSPNIIRYQRSENASGSKCNIPGVNWRNGPDVKEIGMTAINGITKKNNTSVHIAKYI